jgi:hypothetical protein
MYVRSLSLVERLFESILVFNMKKTKKQTNKNNPTKPENLQKKEYLESYEELRKSITQKQEKSENS